MIILDTNVLAALMRTVPEVSVVAWLDRQSAESVWITSITLFEARFGLELLPAGRGSSTNIARVCFPPRTYFAWGCY
jgi:predicted nucleic acid-binding protein